MNNKKCERKSELISLGDLSSQWSSFCTEELKRRAGVSCVTCAKPIEKQGQKKKKRKDASLVCDVCESALFCSDICVKRARSEDIHGEEVLHSGYLTPPVTFLTP
jgi:hypothetical protein